MYLKFIFLNIIVLILQLLLSSCQSSEQKSITEQNFVPIDSNQSFPRLFGMNIGKKHYNESQYIKDLSNLDVVILGFYKGWSIEGKDIKDIISILKKLNPNLLIGQYTILNEMTDDPNDTAKKKIRNTLYSNDWWLLNSAGEKVQWTDHYQAWEINISEWVTPNKEGMYYPEWIARRDFAAFFESIPFDIWYFDNVFYQTRVLADWDLDGFDDDPTSLRIQEVVQQAYVKEWTMAKQLMPDIYIAGNVDHDLSSINYKGKLNGAFLEGLMGRPWSIEKQKGWYAMMDRYHSVLSNTVEPHLVGFNVWGHPEDYKFFRYAYASSLLDDGYFSYTDQNVGYSSVPWFDEYDIKLGYPLTGPVREPWEDSIYRRDFKNGIVLLNPSVSETKTIQLEKEFKKIKGTQDMLINNNNYVRIITLKPKDGLILLNSDR